ncbi:MAG TPA: hypothetical protein VJ810_07855 [Blastocatellia bacterium]|nr:hypothetical protein [Blastocatellia bacterium]
MASVSFTTCFNAVDRWTNLIMFQADYPLQEAPNGQARNRICRIGLAVTMVALTILSASCKGLVTDTDYTIPKLLTPLAKANFEDLTKQLQPFTDLKTFRTQRASMLLTDATASEKFRFELDLALFLERPDKIRMFIQKSSFGTKIADMVSESNQFKVAVLYPADYRAFLIGTNDADYTDLLANFKGKEKDSAIALARPFHFTEALMMRPLLLNDPRFVFETHEELVEEQDARPGAKKGARLLRSFYVVSEIEVSLEGHTPSRVRRKFWFDRGNGARFARQQIFDQQGQLVTEVLYSDYKTLIPNDANMWPSVILVNRHHEGYSARLTFNEEKFEINPLLKSGIFTLDNTENLKVTDLDNPEKKP